MKKYIDMLSGLDLFTGISPAEIPDVLNFCDYMLKSYDAHEAVFQHEINLSYIGIILEGTVDVLHVGYHGNDTIVGRYGIGGVIGESFACLHATNYISDIRCVEPAKILLLNIQPLLTDQPFYSAPCFYLLRNILRSLATSNIQLNMKIQMLSQKTLREKILTCFHMFSRQKHSHSFQLPFNREQLAAYLVSERSSVCREISKLENEGFLCANGRQITLTQ